MRSVLLHGVAIHHAGLPPGDRNIAAHLFALGLVRVMVASATLAWGLNLPARLVIIKVITYFHACMHLCMHACLYACMSACLGYSCEILDV